MSDNRPNVRRVGPGTRDGDTIVVHGWHWGNDEDRRPALPWIGIFLVVFGALLILERFVPAFQLAGSAFVLAVGLVLLIRWAIERGTGSLYAGAIITALALPGTLEGLGIVAGPGLGTLCLGLAFLFIAAVRAAGRGGIGWQAWFGGILAVFGLTRLAIPDIGQLLVPLVLVVFGALLVLQGSRAGSRRA
ncbi:MAG: hypothetical protein ACJ77B_00575 [Chloroflexota bacterium]